MKTESNNRSKVQWHKDVRVAKMNIELLSNKYVISHKNAAYTPCVYNI